MELSLRMLSVIVILGVILRQTSTQSTGDTMIKGAKSTRGSISTLGGDITLYRDLTKPGSNKTMKTAEIIVSFLRLSELHENKMPVMDKNNKTHTMTSFSKQSFSCMAKENFTLPYSTGIKADCWTCWTELMDIFNSAKFGITACVTQGNGTITQDQEVSKVSEGQVKLSIEMTKWPWCDVNCTGGVGKFLDLDLAIKLPPAIKRATKANITKVDNQPTRFELGAGVTVEFSTMSFVDGKPSKLVDNTPALTQTNSSDTVTMRFSRFDALVYDPTFDIGSLAFDPNSSSRLSAVSLPLLLLITMVTGIVTSVIA